MLNVISVHACCIPPAMSSKSAIAFELFCIRAANVARNMRMASVILLVAIDALRGVDIFKLTFFWVVSAFNDTSSAK